MTIIEVFTDGACSGNGTANSAGGVGVHFPSRPDMNVSERLPDTPKPTNNRSELLAVVRALQQCDLIDPNKTYSAMIKSDSQLACNTVNTWLKTWKKAGWLKKDKKPPQNLDILKTLDDLLQHRLVHMKHVRAHTSGQDSDSLHNAIADRLATRAIVPCDGN